MYVCMNISYSEFSDYVRMCTKTEMGFQYTVCMNMCTEFSGVCIYKKYRDGYTIYISIRIVNNLPKKPQIIKAKISCHVKGRE